jgi:hypothetical protein
MLKSSSPRSAGISPGNTCGRPRHKVTRRPRTSADVYAPSSQLRGHFGEPTSHLIASDDGAIVTIPTGLRPRLHVHKFGCDPLVHVVLSVQSACGTDDEFSPSR